MSNYRTLNRTVLAKVETTPGIDAAPTVGANAVLLESPQIQGSPQALDTNEVTGALDVRAPVVGGGGRQWLGTVNMHGSGAGGTAPEWGVFLRGAGMSETTRAADLTGTAQAGAAGSITLAAGATGILVGDIITLTGGTGSGQTRVITAWDNTTKIATIYPNWTVNPDATSTYSVKASQIYVPISTDLKNLTIYDYLHATPAGVNSKLHPLLGGQGNAVFTLPVSGIPRAAFTFSGKFVTPTDVAHPGAATYQAQRPLAFQQADVYLNNVKTKLGTISFDLGNTVQNAVDPADTFGIDVAGITRRGHSGRINPPVALTSERDVLTDFLAGTTRKLWWRWGTPGKAISFYVPQLLYSGSENEDLNGFGHEGIPFGAQGENAGVYITVY